jgi:tRNA(adenine34) deaminase
MEAAMIRAGSKTKVKSKRWVATVDTDSTHPPKGLFTRNAATIAKSLASKRVSPKGPSSGMRMLNYFINRAGRNLSATRRRELEKAKSLLSIKIKAVDKTKDSGPRQAA